MAKTSMIAREKKRARVAEKYAEKRNTLKAILSDLNSSDDEKWAAQVKLQSCLATRARVGVNADAALLGGPTVCIANLVYAAISCAKLLCEEISLV